MKYNIIESKIDRLISISEITEKNIPLLSGVIDKNLQDKTEKDDNTFILTELTNSVSEIMSALSERDYVYTDYFEKINFKLMHMEKGKNKST